MSITLTGFRQFALITFLLPLFGFHVVNAQKTNNEWVIDSVQKIKYNKVVIKEREPNWLPNKEQVLFQISGAEFRGTSKKEIKVSVKYGGGCKLHEFKMIMPPQTSKDKLQLYLIHYSNNDFCRAFVTNNMTFRFKKSTCIKKVKNIFINDFQLK